MLLICLYLKKKQNKTKQNRKKKQQKTPQIFNIIFFKHSGVCYRHANAQHQ